MHTLKTFIFLLSLICFTQCKEQETIKKNLEFSLNGSAFVHNTEIPKRHTGDGDNISPALQWANAPAGTKSFALIVDDPDAPEKIWVHWILFNIPAATTSLPEGVLPNDFIAGATDFFYAQHGKWLYGGPYPPKGDKPHHYHFTLYALDSMLDLTPGAEKDDLIKAMAGHILGEATLIGLYHRP